MPNESPHINCYSKEEVINCNNIWKAQRIGAYVQTAVELMRYSDTFLKGYNKEKI